MGMSYENFKSLSARFENTEQFLSALNEIPQKTFDEYLLREERHHTFNSPVVIQEHTQLNYNLFMEIARVRTAAEICACFDKLSYQTKLKVLSSKVSVWHEGKIAFEYLPRLLEESSVNPVISHIAKSLDALSLTELLKKFSSNASYKNSFPVEYTREDDDFEYGLNDEEYEMYRSIPEQNCDQSDVVSWRQWTNENLKHIYNFATEPEDSIKNHLQKFHEFLEVELVKSHHLFLNRNPSDAADLEVEAKVATRWLDYTNRVLSVPSLNAEVASTVKALQENFQKIHVRATLLKYFSPLKIENIPTIIEKAFLYDPKDFDSELNFMMGELIYSSKKPAKTPDAIDKSHFEFILSALVNPISYFKNWSHSFYSKQQDTTSDNLEPLAYCYLKQAALDGHRAAKKLLYIIAFSNIADADKRKFFEKNLGNSEQIKLEYPDSFEAFLLLLNQKTMDASENKDVVHLNLDATFECWKKFIADNAASSSKATFFKPYSHPYLKPLHELLDAPPLDVDKIFCDELEKKLNDLSSPEKLAHSNLSPEDQHKFAKIFEALKENLKKNFHTIRREKS